MQFKILGIALAAAFSLWGAMAQAAREPLVLEPASAWVMDYADDSCALRRMFKNGDKRAQLEFREFAPDGGLQITVSSGSWPIVHTSVEYRFEPQQDWRKSDNTVYAGFGEGIEGVVLNIEILDEPDDDDREGVIDREADARRAAAFKGIASFSVADAFRDDLNFKTGSMIAPYDAMQTCLDELITHWGIDAEAHKTLTRRAVPKDINVIARRLQSDYPPAMLIKGMPGLLQMRLSVDEKGAVTGCHIQLDISEPEFERAACENVRRAKFEPALDKDGQPIASYWRTRIFYAIG